MMFYRDAMRAFDAVIGEIDGAGSTQKKTGWMKQGWHRRLTWLRWLRQLRNYVQDQETMALARIIEIDRFKAALAAHCVQCPQCQELALNLAGGNQGAQEHAKATSASEAP